MSGSDQYPDMDFLIKNLAFLSARQEAGSQQQAVGKSAGVTQSAISKIIGGTTKEPGYRTVLGLSRHFGVTLDDLVARDLETDWPDTKSQPMGFNTDKLAGLIETVDAAVAKSGRHVPSRTRARIVVALYADNQASSAASADAVQAALASILASLEEA